MLAILERHFDYKTTYIMGDYFLNGCQLFHLKDLERVCNNWFVSPAERESALKAHSELDRTIDMSSYYSHLDTNVHKLLVANGIHLDRLLIDGNFEVLETMANLGIRHEVLYKNKHDYIRSLVAKYGNYHEVLKDDESPMVRNQVLLAGYDPQYFINDDAFMVRLSMIELDHIPLSFLEDERIYVRSEIANKGRYLDILVNDPNYVVRCSTIAKLIEYNETELLRRLLKDEHVSVRMALLLRNYGSYELLDDPDELVRMRAKVNVDYIESVAKLRSRIC